MEAAAASDEAYHNTLGTMVADAIGNITKYSYNSDGTIATSTEPNNESGTGLGNYTAYGYITVHQLTSITPPTGNSLGAQSFTYDGFGRTPHRDQREGDDHHLHLRQPGPPAERDVC